MLPEKTLVRLDGDNGGTCPACGALSKRKASNFCSVCGKLVREGYTPLDSIRSSYRLQGRDLKFKPVLTASRTDLFMQKASSISDIAWACVVYSMVPYLGILFVPLAFVTGSVGYCAGFRRMRVENRRRMVMCVALSLLILGIQIFLWWLLYIIPEIGI